MDLGLIQEEVSGPKGDLALLLEGILFMTIKNLRTPI